MGLGASRMGATSSASVGLRRRRDQGLIATAYSAPLHSTPPRPGRTPAGQISTTRVNSLYRQSLRQRCGISLQWPLMANPDQLPPEVMASQFGIGCLTRHVFLCLGPDCVDPAEGERSWDYLKKRLK